MKGINIAFNGLRRPRRALRLISEKIRRCQTKWSNLLLTSVRWHFSSNDLSNSDSFTRIIRLTAGCSGVHHDTNVDVTWENIILMEFNVWQSSFSLILFTNFSEFSETSVHSWVKYSWKFYCTLILGQQMKMNFTLILKYKIHGY